MEVSIRNIFKNTLSSIIVYSLEERKAITFLILEKTLGLTRTKILTDRPIEASKKEQLHQIDQVVKEVNQYKPIQYIFNEAYFFGHKLYVDEHVLIPRPETEELVDKILRDHHGIENLSVADWCTGSGCIAISLAAAMPTATVTGLDISAEALDIAKKNALANKVQVNWVQQDILALSTFEVDKYDIIVSNPPYVTDAESHEMSENVLLFEPHLALFVPDHQPLLFYEAIIQKAAQMLKKQGKLYLEINEQFGKQIKSLLANHLFKKIEIIKDLNGKDRMAVGVVGDS